MQWPRPTGSRLGALDDAPGQKVVCALVGEMVG